MNDILLTGAVTIVTASCIWDFVKFLINRKDGKEGELVGIKKAIEALSDKVDRNQAILARTHILRFCDELLAGQVHSREYFQQQLQDIDTYEAYCAAHPDFKNNYAVIASEHIKNTYKELLDRKEWTT